MTTPWDIENLRPVFEKILQVHQLSAKDVRSEGCVIAVSDKGLFQCANCLRSWSSNFSWVSFHLKDLEINHRWKMKCKFCSLDCIPTFTIEQLQRMFGKAVLFYKGDRSPAVMTFAPRRRRPYQYEPHHPDLCEMCSCWGAEHCWYKPYYIIR